MSPEKSLVQRNRGGTRKLIVDEAELLIAKGGYDSLRLRDIADALGIKVPSIYAHFSGREAVVSAVAERYMQILAQQFPYRDGEDPTEALKQGIALLVEAWASNPCYLRLKLRNLERGMSGFDVPGEGTPSRNLESGPLAPMFERLGKMLDCGVQQGVFGKVERLEMVHVIWGTSLLALTYPSKNFLEATDYELQGVVDEVTRVAFSVLLPKCSGQGA